MSNIYARLDHLIDRFKHDVRDIIDSAVAEEKDALIKKLDTFLNTKEGRAVEVAKTIVAEEPEVVVPEPAEQLECGFCKRRGEPCVKHGGKPTKYIPKKKLKVSREVIMLPAGESAKKEGSAQLSNRPLIEFVGKKKKPFICSYCGKPCDDRYCSAHCEREDKLFNEMISNKGKTYAQIMTEKGVKPKKVTFEYKDRREKKPLV